MTETILGYYIGTTILFGVFTVINVYLYFLNKRRDEEFDKSRSLLMEHVDNTMVNFENKIEKIKGISIKKFD